MLALIRPRFVIYITQSHTGDSVYLSSPLSVSALQHNKIQRASVTLVDPWPPAQVLNRNSICQVKRMTIGMFWQCFIREEWRENHSGYCGGWGFRLWSLCGRFPLGPLHAPHRLHLPPQPLRDDEAGPGVRESRHIPAGKGEERRSCRTWTVLHHSLLGHHSDRRPQNHHIWRPAPGDPDQGLCVRTLLLGLMFISNINGNSTVAVDAVVYFKIFNPMNSVINVQNAHQSTRLLASTTLRNMLGTKNLHVRILLL